MPNPTHSPLAEPLQPPAAPSELEEAAALREAGRYREAAAWLEARLKARGEHAAALALLAHVLLLDNRDDEAATALARAQALDPRLPALWRNAARLALKRARPDEALAAARRALAAEPADAEGLLVAASALCAAGRDAEAQPLVERVLAACPAYAEAHAARALIRLRAQDAAGALADAEQALARKPHLALWPLVSRLRHQLGDLPGAIEAMRQAADREPDRPGHAAHLGDLLRQAGRLDEAVPRLEAAAARFPDDALVRANLGAALHDAGRMEAARDALEEALRRDAGLDLARRNLALLLCRLAGRGDDDGQAEEAEALCRRACELAPAEAEPLIGLAVLLNKRERFEQAEECCRRAIALAPDRAKAHAVLGNVLVMRQRHPDAVAAFRRAIAIDPKFVRVHRSLGNLLKDLGRPEEAERCYRQALEASPGEPINTLCAELMQPAILPSAAALAGWRARYAGGLRRLEASPIRLNEELLRHVGTDAFDLAYHGEDDRPLLEALSRMFRAKAPFLDWQAPHLAGWRGPAGRIRVGFCSQFLVMHTIGKLYQGFLAGLDRARFEVVLIHAPHAKRNASSEKLVERHADKVIQLPAGLSAQREAIAAERLDVLFYPDIGMSSAMYFLAHARLAPVQAVSWGHPDTSGIDTLDYFLSSELIEPEGAEAHYSERLVRLGRLPCFYQPFAAPATIPGRATLGLPLDGTLYGCPQSLFKIHPEYDAVLAEIAVGDPQGHIVLVEGQVPDWNDLLRERWASVHPRLAERALFLPRQPLGRFMALMAHFDVLLDPIHFGSGNTLYEAMVYGTPIVTWPGRHMRGRIVAGAYRQMGVADAPVAERLEDYAPLALALGRDPARRRRLRQAALQAAGRELYADARALRAFEEFLAAAVAAAAAADKLPAGWRAPG